MRNLGTALFAIALFSASALAQQPPSAGEQALSDRLIAEIQANVQARTQLIETQRQFNAAQARVKALEEKYEPKAEPKAGSPK